MITRAEILALGMPLDDHGAIADALSEGRTKIVSTPIGVGTILKVMAPMGGMFMGALRDIGATSPRTIDSANVFEAVGMIDRGTFDVGDPVTRTQLEKFALAVPAMAPGITALLNVALVPDPVTEFDIRCVMYDPLTGELLNG